MTNEALMNYSKSNKTKIARILERYYKQDPFLIRELRIIVSMLIGGECTYDQLKDIDRELEELGSPWDLCASDVRPLSYEMVVSLRQYITDVQVKMVEAMRY